MLVVASPSLSRRRPVASEGLVLRAEMAYPREELRNRNYLPVLFDFEKPASKDLTGTIV